MQQQQQHRCGWSLPPPTRLVLVVLVVTVVVSGSSSSFAITSSNARTAVTQKKKSATLLWAASETTTKKTAQQQASSSSSSSSSSSLASLQQWAAETAGIKTSPTIQLQDDRQNGRGWYTTASNSIQQGALLLTVPAQVALTVKCPGLGPDDDGQVRRLLGDTGRAVLKQLPWFVQMALYLYKLDQVDSSKNNEKLDMRVWLDSLPRRGDFDATTPIHWSVEQRRDLLQYPYLEQSVAVQETKWKRYYTIVQSALQQKGPLLSYDDFVWYCELAQSRAFSSSYTGAAFSPALYAFTLLLVAAYLALGLGTLEQAANGAGVVFCVAVLKDFVLPKLFQKDERLYVMAPMMDMANHKSISSSSSSSSHHQAKVSFEYFGNTYSLASVQTTTTTTLQDDSNNKDDNQVYISYGERTNDQLLQFYGFVETDNPFDVYIMPPLREWNISALESVVTTAMPSRGPSFAPGRLQKLDAAGLLGISSSTSSSAKKDNGGSNTDDDGMMAVDSTNIREAGGIVLTRQFGLDPAVLQALRALVATPLEWKNAGESVASFAEFTSPENEAMARLVARTAMEMELQSKPTTLQQDQELLKRLLNSKKQGGSSSLMLDAASSPQEILAVRFRIEKKKLLLETIDKLR